jgi:two-component system, NtrC family, sensor kinase
MRMKFRWFVCNFLFLFGTCNFPFAQRALIDSLVHQLYTAKDDVSQSKIMTELIGAYIEFNPDSAAYYANKEHLLARKAGLLEGEANALRGLGYLAMQRGDYPLALEYAQKSLSISIATNLKNLTERSYTSIGLVYFYMEDYSKALAYFFKAKEQFSNTTQSPTQSDVLNNIARCYLKTGKPDSALFYCQEAIKIAKEANLPRYLGLFQNTLGEATVALGHEKKGIGLMRQGLQTSLQQNNSRTLLVGFLSIAAYYSSKRQFDSTLLYLHNAIDLAQRRGYTRQLHESSLLMASAFHARRREDSAYYYLQWSSELRNKLFSQENLHRVSALEFSDQFHQQELAAAKETLQHKTRVYVLLCLVGLFIAVSLLLYRHNLHRKKSFDLLERQKRQTEDAYKQLKDTQTQLIQREKMASLGELTAGIAHEIQNPLNFINNFSEVNRELIAEIKEEIEANRKEGALTLAGSIEDNEMKIAYHGKRADAIVKGMLEHSRSARTEKQPTDINSLAEEYIKLSYQGFKAKVGSLDIQIETHFDPFIGCIDVIPQEVGRVLVNLLNNAYYSVQEKKTLFNGTYEPQVQVFTRKSKDFIEISVKDNGTGIPLKIAEKVFQPFFTTKPTGEGTGLGLSLSYDIITKGYGGEIIVLSKEGEGAEFKVQLPTK